MIRVEKDAQKTNAYQENRNLLLSEKAHADSIPGLEILANDVRCTHGATLSQVDRDQLFYAMARGLTRADAERLIVRGFFQDILDRIELAAGARGPGRGPGSPYPAGVGFLAVRRAVGAVLIVVTAAGVVTASDDAVHVHADGHGHRRVVRLRRARTAHPAPAPGTSRVCCRERSGAG